MSDADNQRALLLEARGLAENVDGTADQLLALAHASYRAWTRNRRLHFPEPRRHALLLEILRYCANSHLLECAQFEQSRVSMVEHAMDASYPFPQAEKTRYFAAAIGLKPLTAPVCSPQSNGMAESFVKTMKRDYIAFIVNANRNLHVWGGRNLQRAKPMFLHSLCGTALTNTPVGRWCWPEAPDF